MSNLPDPDPDAARPPIPPVWDVEVDARDLLYPLPVLKARRTLARLAPGAVLRLMATDPAAVVDVPHFCTEAGHDFLGTGTDDGAAVYFIRRGAA